MNVYVNVIHHLVFVMEGAVGVICTSKYIFVYYLEQRFSNFFQVGTTIISQNVLRTTLLLGLSNSVGLP